MSQSTLRVIDSLVQWRSFNETRSTRSDTIDLSICETLKFQFAKRKVSNIIKWGASFRWSSSEDSSLYCSMQDSDEMTIGRTHPTLIYDNL